jgi:hypothetical protein
MASLESRPVDTSPEAYEIWLKHLRQRPLERRLLDVLALCDQGRELSKAGIRMRHPEYSEEQVELSLRAWFRQNS